MTQAEIAQLLMYVRASKPNAWVFQDPEQQNMTMMVWHRKLCEFSLELAIEGVDAFFSIPENRKNSTLPMPEDIRDFILTENNPDLAFNLDDVFGKVNRKVLETSPYPLYAGGTEIHTDDVLRSKLTELEWEALQMVGGHMRFRDATPKNLDFLRNDYKRVLSELLVQAKRGTFEAKYTPQPTLEDLNKAALKAEAQGFDTAKIQQFIKGFRK